MASHYERNTNHKAKTQAGHDAGYNDDDEDQIHDWVGIST
jgi:hypothetical protein